MMLRLLLDNVVLQHGLSVSARNRMVLNCIFVMAGAVALWMIACYYRNVFGALAGHRMIRDLRVALVRPCATVSHPFFARKQTGGIVSRVVNDMSLAQNFVGSALTNVWMDTITLLVLVVVLFSINPSIALVSLLLMRST
jgi:ABC-type multidrug transport system fused ATPase/permease subunit